MHSLCFRFKVKDLLPFWKTDRIRSHGKVVPVHAMKAYRGRRSIAALILNLGTRWRRVFNFTPRPLYVGERTVALTGRRRG